MNNGEDVEHSHRTDVTDRERMLALLDRLSSYIEQFHGGWVRLVDYDGKVLRVELGGACAGCHLSATTLQGWVAGTVRQFFPAVERIEQV